MISLKLLKTAERKAAHLDKDGLVIAHGRLVLNLLVVAWAVTFRLVCAEFYFLSVSSVEVLKMGLRFI